jgi:hypothetical protein
MSILHFIASIIANGGASFNLKSGVLNPDYGYMVSIKDHEIKALYNETTLEKQVHDYIISQLEFLETTDRDLWLGGWIDGDHLYLDLNDLFLTAPVAAAIAELRHQIAYYDNQNKVCVYLVAV